MKSQIIEQLGQADILLPSLVAEGLAANDRIKVRMSALQAAVHHAREPDRPATDLHVECHAAGIAPAALATLIGGAHLAGDGRIATGDVKAVPAGKYAKAALEKLGAWTAAESKFAMADSVRAALTLVARGETILGIVYATDAAVESGVRIVGTFPADSHPAIVYPVAATTTAKADTFGYLAFLRSTVAKTIFEKYGFKFLVSPIS